MEGGPFRSSAQKNVKFDCLAAPQRRVAMGDDRFEDLDK
jgi:hypothetical protein